jgi:1-phosphatidylinositol-3-phosphate 5-kinase
MESPPTYSPVQSTYSTSLPSSTTRLGDDITSLTSFNPFSEEDENDHSSYALVTSLFSRMKNSFAVPLSSSTVTPSGPPGATIGEQRRPSATAANSGSSFPSRPSPPERPSSLTVVPSKAAPPLVSLTPVVSDPPSFGAERDHSPSRSGQYTPVYETHDGAAFGTAIPGFPIQDDARSIRTTASLNRSASVSKVIRRIRGEGNYKVPSLHAF